MDLAEVGFGIAVIWLIIIHIVRPLLPKKNGHSESAKGTDDLAHIKDRIDWMYDHHSERDDKKIYMTWRNLDLDKKDHENIGLILEIQEETNKSIASIAERLEK